MYVQTSRREKLTVHCPCFVVLAFRADINILWSQISYIFNVQCMEYQKNGVPVDPNQNGFCDHVQQNKKVNRFFVSPNGSKLSFEQLSKNENYKKFFQMLEDYLFTPISSVSCNYKRVSSCDFSPPNFLLLSKNFLMLLIITLNCFPNWIRIRREFFI